MRDALSTYHPGVPLAYFACTVVLALVTRQPAFALVGALGAIVCLFLVRDRDEALTTLAWVLPLWALVAVLNPLILGLGSTVLFRLGPLVMRWESLAFGICSGASLAAVVLWLSCLGACVSSDDLLAMAGGPLPVVSLMLSQVMRLVPQVLRRGREVLAAQDANLGERPAAEFAGSRLRSLTVLMAWAMEDGITRSDSMRARGYVPGARRTSYPRCTLRTRDVAALAFVLVLGVIAIGCALSCGSYYDFYPTMQPVVLDARLVPAVLLVTLPVPVALGEWLAWR